MKLNDAIFGLIFLVLGAAILFVVQAFPKIPGQQVGPGLFPGLIAVGLCVCGVLLISSGWRQRASAPWVAMEEWVRSPRHVLAFFVLLGSIVFYMLVATALGFLPTAIIILATLFYVLKVPAARALLIAVIAALAIHFIFYKLLRVPLPWGVLTNYAW